MQIFSKGVSMATTTIAWSHRSCPAEDKASQMYKLLQYRKPLQCYELLINV